jgi:hypothetical protein
MGAFSQMLPSPAAFCERLEWIFTRDGVKQGLKFHPENITYDASTRSVRKSGSRVLRDGASY